MKVLIVPMSAIAETSGPVSRAMIIAKEMKKSGVEVATCMAEDINYRKINEINNYFLDIPMPLGLPKIIAAHTFPVAQKLGIVSRKKVNSFDDVLWITGNLDYSYIKKSINSIRKAIRDFRPDLVYSEFNISAIIAAKIENIRIAITVSKPTQYEYAHNTKCCFGLVRILKELGLPYVNSALQLFDWADEMFCPSIPELETLNNKNVIFCGALKKVAYSNSKRNKILVYMGNGTIPARKIQKEIIKAFIGSDYEVYIASKYLQEETISNIHIGTYWDFETLLNEAVVFINHGGQNSIIDGIIHMVPQIIFPGKVFERKYNADSIQNNNAGISLKSNEFRSDIIIRSTNELSASEQTKENIRNLRNKLLESGGAETIAIHFKL